MEEVLAKIGHFATFRDVREQNVHEGVLTVERRAALIFECNNSFDGREVAFSESVILSAKESFPPAPRIYGIDPIVHDAATYERFHLGRPGPGMKQQPVYAMGAVIHGKLCEWH